MLEREITISNKLGLHARARPSSCSCCRDFQCNAWLIHRGREVNAKSIMGVMMLAAGVGSTITLRTDGADEAAAIDAMVDLFDRKFDEGAMSSALRHRTAFSAARGMTLGRARLVAAGTRVNIDERPLPNARSSRKSRNLRDATRRTRASELQSALREKLHGALAREVGEFIDAHSLMLDDPELTSRPVRSDPHAAAIAPAPR